VADPKNIRRALGYAGLLPFVVPALLVASGSGHAESAAAVAGVYAFGIVSFLCGSWWGFALTPSRSAIPLLSNAFFLFALGGFLLVPGWWPLIASLLLAALYLVERDASAMPSFEDDYRALRRNLSLIASLSMLTVQIAA
jgi:hypothetical protein